MLVIGLTGGIASGKSTVSKMLQEYGVPIIDGDVISREIMEPPSDALKKISVGFGATVMNEDGSLNRKRLSEIVFNNQEELKKLNWITHPIIKEKVLEKLSYYKALNYNLCVLDAALLIEGNFTDLVDIVMVVYANRKIQLQRILVRDLISEEKAQRIIDSQMPFEEKKHFADYIIDNSHDLAATKQQVDLIMKKISGLEGSNV